MKTRLIKMKIIITLAVIITAIGPSKAQNIKQAKLAKHLDVVTLLADVKKRASSLQNYSKDWNGKDLDEMKKLYGDLQVADERLIVRYQSIIEHYRTAKKANLTADAEIENLQQANNNFVSYFNSNYQKHPSKPQLGIWAEVIKVVFESGKQIYDFVNGINEKTKATYLNDLKDKSIPNWGVAATSQKSS